MRWTAQPLICFWLSNVVFVSSAWKNLQLDKGDYPENSHDVFFLMNSVVLDRLCVSILFQNASSHFCFRFFVKNNANFIRSKHLSQTTNRWIGYYTNERREERNLICSACSWWRCLELGMENASTSLMCQCNCALAHFRT